MQKLRSLLVLTTAAMGLVGCGGSDQKSTAQVTGKVTYNGQPVTGGTLMFDPKGGGSGSPGKGGAGYIQEDGSFTVTTYTDGDGAVVGPHLLSYEPPAATLVGEASTSSGQPASNQRMIPSPYAGLVPKTTEVTVEEGGTVLEVTLVKR